MEKKFLLAGQPSTLINQSFMPECFARTIAAQSALLRLFGLLRRSPIQNGLSKKWLARTQKAARAEYGEETFTNRFLAVFPYAELRQDDNSPLYLRSYCPDGYTARESVTAETFAATIKAAGVTESIFLDPHSEKALRHFAGMETLCLTAAPLFADWLLKKPEDGEALINKNNYKTTAFVPLDLGAAQKNMHLAKIIKERTGWDIRVVALGKKRSGHSEVGEQDILCGNLEGIENVFLFDDSGASFGSILKTAKSLKVSRVIPCISHGVLCGKYLENIMSAVNLGVVPKFAITNSLPQADRVGSLPISESLIDVLPVENMMAFFAREVALRSIKEVKEDPRFWEYVLTPKSKLQVGLELGIPFETITHSLELEPNSVPLIEEALRLPVSVREKLPEDLRKRINSIFEFQLPGHLDAIIYQEIARIANLVNQLLKS